MKPIRTKTYCISLEALGRSDVKLGLTSWLQRGAFWLRHPLAFLWKQRPALAEPNLSWAPLFGPCLFHESHYSSSIGFREYRHRANLAISDFSFSSACFHIVRLVSTPTATQTNKPHWLSISGLPIPNLGHTEDSYWHQTYSASRPNQSISSFFPPTNHHLYKRLILFLY